jgi:uncharacterized damage-inducible protein DinB
MNAADREILADFERTRDKTIELLKNVPPPMLMRRARGEEASLGLLFHHIAGAVDGWMARCMQDGGKLPDWNLKATPSKDALLKSLKASQRRLLRFFKAKDGAAMNATYRRERKGKKYSFVGRNRVLYLTQHEAHHRGKIVLALRQWGFTKVPFLPY